VVGAANYWSAFSSTLISNPGTAGAQGTSGHILGGDGGSATGGDINVNGSKGGNADTFDLGSYISGRGANSLLGTGGAEVTSNAAGNAASGYGSGGGGGWGSSGNPIAGGAGSQGVILLTEYF